MSSTTPRKRMTQSEVINHFAEKFDLKRTQVKEFFDELADLAAREVKENGEFVLPGFGKLVRSERKAREGRNPATGETIQIPAKTALKFRIGKSMKTDVLGSSGRPRPNGFTKKNGGSGGGNTTESDF